MNKITNNELLNIINKQWASTNDIMKIGCVGKNQALKIKKEILDELKIEMGVTLDSDIAILNVKLKNAIREVRQAVSYNPKHTEEFILEDMKNYVGQIKDLTMYDYSLIGGEGEKSHSENGTRREWKDRKDCFAGIVRFADV